MARVRALGRAGLVKTTPPSTQTTAPPPPPLGLGVILFVGADGKVAGVAVTGLPPSSFSPLVHAAMRAALREDLSAKSSQELLAEAGSKASSAGSFDLGGGDRWDPQWEATRLRRLRNMQRLAQTIVHSACGAASPELMPRSNYRFTARTKSLSPSSRAVCVLPDKITSGATDVSSKDRIAAAYVRGLRGGGG